MYSITNKQVHFLVTRHFNGHFLGKLGLTRWCCILFSIRPYSEHDRPKLFISFLLYL